MNSYERIMAILEGRKEEIDRLPCFCSTRCYNVDSMKTFDAYWPEAHRDPEKMARLAAGLYRLAGNENISVPFEMTLEAEALGAPLQFFEGQIKWASVTKLIAQDISDLKFPKDPSEAGRIPVICEAIKILKKEFEGEVPIMAIINCPFTSISSYLVEPVEFLKWVRTNPDKVHQFYKETVPYYADFANAFKEAGADIVIYTEEAASLDNISPKQFDEFIKPHLTKLISLTKPPRILHMCGELISREKPEIETISKMVECGAEAITIGERTFMKAAREIVDRVKPGYPIGGNINAFTVIHNGPIEMIRTAVRRVIDEGTDMVCPGCDYWLETPTEHIKAFVDATIEFGTPQSWK